MKTQKNQGASSTCLNSPSVRLCVPRTVLEHVQSMGRWRPSGRLERGKGRGGHLNGDSTKTPAFHISPFAQLRWGPSSRLEGTVHFSLFDSGNHELADCRHSYSRRITKTILLETGLRVKEASRLQTGSRNRRTPDCVSVSEPFCQRGAAEGH